TSWAPQTSGTTNELRSVHFVSDNEGWAAGANVTLLHTTNSGSAWAPVNTGAEAARGFTTVRFLDQNTGFAGGTSVVARTTNGGANWTLATLPSTLPLTNNNMLNVLYTSFFPLAGTQFWTSGGGTFQNQGVAGGTMALYELNASGQLSLLAPIAVGNLSGNIKNINDVQFFSTVSGLGVGDVGLIVKAELQQS